MVILVSSCNKFINNLEMKNKDINDDLILSIQNNNKDKIIELIKKGANINSKTSEGNTPLKIALNRGFIEIISLLLENGIELKRMISFP